MLGKLLSTCLLTTTIIAVEPPALPVTEVALYKNGLAVIRHQGELPAQDEVLVEPAGNPVHGTLWLKNKAGASLHTVEVPGAIASFSWRHLHGQQVTVKVGDEELSGLLTLSEEVAVSPQAQQQRWSYGWNYYQAPAVHSHQQWGVITDAQGVSRPIALASATIVSCPDFTIDDMRRMKTQLAVRAPRGGATELNYLTYGLSWAPAYHLSLQPDGSATFIQQALIRNELKNLGRPEILVITGHPQIELGHVVAPLGAQQNWNTFFQQLVQAEDGGHVYRGNRYASQMMNVYVGNDAGAEGPRPGQVPSQGDLYKQSVGKHQLDKGSVLQIPTFTTTIACKKVVKWEISDEYDANAQHYNYHGREAPPRNEAWNALLFTNPLDQPLTTAPVNIEEDGRFVAQNGLTYTGAGQECCLKTTKALSVQVSHQAVEVEGAREHVSLGGRNYRRAVVSGTCQVSNKRDEAIEIVVKRSFSGELISAERSPKATLSATGAGSVNPQREMTWRVNVPAHETLSWTYKYRLLSYH